MRRPWTHAAHCRHIADPDHREQRSYDCSDAGYAELRLNCSELLMDSNIHPASWNHQFEPRPLHPPDAIVDWLQVRPRRMRQLTMCWSKRA